jgi:hypothetical protein
LSGTSAIARAASGDSSRKRQITQVAIIAIVARALVFLKTLSPTGIAAPTLAGAPISDNGNAI